MKNLRSYLASGIPSPSHSKKMAGKPARAKVVFTKRQLRRAARMMKRGEA